MATPVLVNGATGLLATAIFVNGADCYVQGYHIYNPSNAAAYVQFFDSLVAPTVGTTVPMWSVGATTLTSVMLWLPEAGLYFRDGLWVAATTTAGGLTAPNVAVSVNLAMSR